MKKISPILVLLPALVVFCVSLGSQDCNKDEFVKRDYLREYDIKAEDLSFFLVPDEDNPLHIYTIINKGIGYAAFAHCKICSVGSVFEENILRNDAKRYSRLLKLQKQYKDKVWKEETSE